MVLLKEIKFNEGKHCKVSDSEVITTVLLVAENFYENHSSVIKFFKQIYMISNVLYKNKFNKKLCKLERESS